MDIEQIKLNEDHPVECYCKRCHRKLTNPKYAELGMGPVCYEKSKRALKTKPLFEIKKRSADETH